MLAAGLLAKKAVERGLTVSPTVKTSLAPGSRAVIEYLEKAGLMTYLDQLHFNLVGFGCTTCIGNSGPLDEPVAKAVDENNLVVAAVLSGNRNFEGRIHPQVRASYLASPPLVVAYALAGTVDIDLRTEPLGTGKDGEPVFLRDIWPTNAEIAEAVRSVRHAGAASARRTATSSTATSAGGRSTCPRAGSGSGTRNRRTCASRRSCRASRTSRRRSPTSTTRACW